MSTIRISKEGLAEVAGNYEPGYAHAVLTSADKVEDGWVYVQPDIWMDIMSRYKPTGLGTMVYFVAHPIAAAAGISNCGGCAGRMDWLNTTPAKTVKKLLDLAKAT